MSTFQLTWSWHFFWKIDHEILGQTPIFPGASLRSGPSQALWAARPEEVKTSRPSCLRWFSIIRMDWIVILWRHWIWTINNISILCYYIYIYIIVLYIYICVCELYVTIQNYTNYTELSHKMRIANSEPWPTYSVYTWPHFSTRPWAWHIFRWSRRCHPFLWHLTFNVFNLDINHILSHKFS